MESIRNKQQVCFSNQFKEQNINLLNDNTVQGYKGWSTILTSYPIIEGTFFCEMLVTHNRDPLPFPNAIPHVRVGVTTSKQNLEMPIGSQPFSYTYRDVNGAKYNNAKSELYGEDYKLGDYIGILLHLSPRTPLYSKVENEDYRINKMSKIIFFKNGVCQGEAFTDLKQDIYYFGISLYMRGTVQFFSGPRFVYDVMNYEEIKKQFPKIQPYCEAKTQINLYSDIAQTQY